VQAKHNLRLAVSHLWWADRLRLLRPYPQPCKIALCQWMSAATGTSITADYETPSI